MALDENGNQIPDAAPQPLQQQGPNTFRRQVRPLRTPLTGTPMNPTLPTGTLAGRMAQAGLSQGGQQEMNGGNQAIGAIQRGPSRMGGLAGYRASRSPGNIVSRGLEGYRKLPMAAQIGHAMINPFTGIPMAIAANRKQIGAGFRRFGRGIKNFGKRAIGGIAGLFKPRQ